MPAPQTFSYRDSRAAFFVLVSASSASGEGARGDGDGARACSLFLRFSSVWPLLRRSAQRFRASSSAGTAKAPAFSTSSSRISFSGCFGMGSSLLCTALAPVCPLRGGRTILAPSGEHRDSHSASTSCSTLSGPFTSAIGSHGWAPSSGTDFAHPDTPVPFSTLSTTAWRYGNWSLMPLRTRAKKCASRSSTLTRRMLSALKRNFSCTSSTSPPKG
mmetsp:Transcript_17945/g.61171  ORF Transcript_17945/g.61171 Transcript_17945/m.61171 type:complete len:216 (+) Transcript_17945:1257-1904(+)